MFWNRGPDKSSDEKSADGKTALPATATSTDASSSSPFGNSKSRDVKNTAVYPDKMPDPKKLPKSLQRMVDEDDDLYDPYNDIFSGYAPESTESNVRYAAYAARFRTILTSAHRYVAYTSDIGESFRPVAHPGLVRSAYAVSWAYILGDVSYEGYKAYLHNQRTLNPALQLTRRQSKIAHMDSTPAAAAPAAPGVITPLEDWRTVMAQRAIFQSIASMGLPAFTIHSVVRYSGRALKNLKNKTVRTWAPIGLGLAVVPFLPRLFDEPVENAVEWVFHNAFAAVGGKDAVGDSPTMGREKNLSKKPAKEKEL